MRIDQESPTATEARNDANFAALNAANASKAAAPVAGSLAPGSDAVVAAASQEQPNAMVCN